MTPGWKTTEFWTTMLLVVIGATLASGLLPEHGVAVKVLGIVVAAVKAVQYTMSRTALKVEAEQTARVQALADAGASIAPEGRGWLGPPPAPPVAPPPAPPAGLGVPPG